MRLRKRHACAFEGQQDFGRASLHTVWSVLSVSLGRRLLLIGAAMERNGFRCPLPAGADYSVVDVLLGVLALPGRPIYETRRGTWWVQSFRRQMCGVSRFAKTRCCASFAFHAPLTISFQ